VQCVGFASNEFGFAGRFFTPARRIFPLLLLRVHC
jgi:hypothetical protein